ncbi:MAG: response regulator transcription factor [Bacteroidota bacterium]
MHDLKILVVDDEVLIAEDISDILKSFGIRPIKLAHDKETVITLISSFNPEMVLLDIRMENETSGLQLGEVLQMKGIPFIYITSHTNVAMVQKIIKTKPFGYLSKPLKKTDLLANLLMFNENLRAKNNDQLTVKDNGITYLLNTNDIKYIKSDGNYITIYCINDTYVFRKNIESFYDEIDHKTFFKPHRSYIINLSKVRSYTTKEILIDDIEIPVSRLLKNDFLNRMNER